MRFASARSAAVSHYLLRRRFGLWGYWWFSALVDSSFFEGSGAVEKSLLSRIEPIKSLKSPRKAGIPCFFSGIILRYLNLGFFTVPFFQKPPNIDL